MGQTTCGTCGNVQTFPDYLAGEPAKCVHCHDLMRLPGEKIPVATLLEEPQPRQQISPGAAAVLSLFIPGLGQLCQGRFLIGFLWILVTLTGYLMWIVPGFVLHLCCVVNAARS